MNKTVRKAIIPAAGLGTRFLPATKVQAKEMLSTVQDIYNMVNIHYIRQKNKGTWICSLLCKKFYRKWAFCSFTWR